MWPDQVGRREIRQDKDPQIGIAARCGDTLPRPVSLPDWMEIMQG